MILAQSPFASVRDMTTVAVGSCLFACAGYDAQQPSDVSELAGPAAGRTQTRISILPAEQQTASHWRSFAGQVSSLADY